MNHITITFKKDIETPIKLTQSTSNINFTLIKSYQKPIEKYELKIPPCLNSFMPKQYFTEYIPFQMGKTISNDIGHFHFGYMFDKPTLTFDTVIFKVPEDTKATFVYYYG